MVPGPVPPIIGHRGAMAAAPENTLASLREAARQGAEWVEFDVKLTRDGVPVLFHDGTLRRITGASGGVADHTLSELRAMDAGAWFSPGFAGERIPTLAEAISVLAECGLGANVELKPCAGSEEATGRVTAAFLRDDWPGSLPPPVLSSFSEAALVAARGEAPDLPRALLVREVPPDWRRRLDALGCGALHAAAGPLRRSQAAAVTAAGFPLRCYTVDDPARARELFGWGAASVFTNAPKRLLEALRPTP